MTLLCGYHFCLDEQAAANRASSNLAGAILLMEKLAEWVFHTTHYTSERAARVTHQIVLDYNGLAMLCLSQGKFASCRSSCVYVVLGTMHCPLRVANALSP